MRSVSLLDGILVVSLLLFRPLVAELHAQQADTRVGRTAAPDTVPLRPGDVIRVSIWPAIEFSQDVSIDQDGVATFRRLGPLSVTAQSPERVRANLVTGYTRYVRNPSIEVTFLRRVTVGGAVQKPGLYPVDPTMTLLDVIALAGGPNFQGDPRHIDVLKAGAAKPHRYDRNSTTGQVGLSSGDQVSVPERSFISRNSGIVAAVITAAASLIVAFHR
jgi:protein involved in polysaccharide export with SLBB domain